MKKDQVRKQENKSRPKSVEENKSWYLIDAENKVLGRVSSEIAKILMGKDKVDFARYHDMGDNVVVINAAKVAVTGRKETDKKYYRYSGYPGGLKEISLEKQREKKPEELIYHAVAGMLPKNRLGSQLIKKLYVYPKEAHPHEAQKPKELEVV